MAAAQKSASKRSFHQELVLNRWLLGFFQGGSLTALKQRLMQDEHEGIAEDGQTGFFHALMQNLFEVDRISQAELRRHDLNIVRYWQTITERRNQREGHELHMKYFQYLSLLFTEIYLDWFFNRQPALLAELNTALASYKAEPGAEPFRDFAPDDLNKIAFWNATGSGKTLLLHVNLLQYLHHFERRHPGQHPSKIILLTPNEGLSRQHLEELHLSGFSYARYFDKSQSGSFRGTVEIIDINKLGDEMGDKTVAVEAFEGNNLVLIDEGHRGAGAGAGVWMQRREALVSSGFGFEYSATFGQAVAKGQTVEQAEEDIRKKRAKMLFDTSSLKKLDEQQLQQLMLTDSDKQRARLQATRESYAKCILFDYSYKFFYEDGYGKESLILNLATDDDPAIRQLYFTACLLSHYQQLWLWSEHRDKLADFNIEKPLWVFVGNKVADEDSDILAVIHFLADFLNDERRAQNWLADLVSDRARLLDQQGRNIFQNRFAPLMSWKGREAELYADILQRLFNAPSRQRLKLVNLKNSKGELALRVGEADPFGLINIGDDAGFFNTAKEHTSFDSEADDFGTALFSNINHAKSPLNILIGSRKFTEGWSSWRVSTMGLLNMGQGEGTQIIQLFGRGVRLKGRDYSLKRSLPSERPKGLHLDKLETLNIFGVRAHYMAQFKAYLKEEGVTPSDEIITLDFQTRTNLPLARLKSLALKDGYKDNQKLGFKRHVFPELYAIPPEFEGKLKLPHVVLDLYPRLEAMSTQDKGRTLSPTIEARKTGKLPTSLMAFFDFDRIFLALQDYKLQRSWSNLRLDRQRLIDFCRGDTGWYTMFVPPAELTLGSFGDIRKQEDLLIRLLIDYTDRFYKSLKTAYEGQFYQVITVDEDHGSVLKFYQFAIENSEEGLEYKAQLDVLQALVLSGKLGQASQASPNHMVAICFDRHLFYPLLAFEDDADKASVPLKMQPLGLGAESEVTFVKDLEAFYQSPQGKAAIGERSLYLLRNAANAQHGLGFALAGNFYPDFLLWLVDDQTGKQWLSFVDPKGLRHMDLSHPKLGLYKEVKTLEAKLGDPLLTLNAFILSPTRFADLLNVGGPEQKALLEGKHVLFMEDGRDAYLQKLFARVV